MFNLEKFPEWRILGVLGVVAVSWYLLSLVSGLLGVFADVLILMFLAWIMAFIIEPVVEQLETRGVKRTGAAILVYLGIAILVGIVIGVVLPTTISQLSQFSGVLPNYLPENALWTPRIEGFLSSTLNNSVVLASQVASALTGVLLVFILSFYFLISRGEISRTIKRIIPDQYEEDYKFLETVINTTFASFIRIQVLMGLVLGMVAFVVLAILRINFALSTAIMAAILAMIPVVGPVLFLIPPALAAATVSFNQLIIVTAVLVLVAQLIYNVWAPRLLGKALRIHPIIVLLSFLVGYKLAGFWGAIFAVPVVSAMTVIGKDILWYWKEEADKR